MKPSIDVTYFRRPDVPDFEVTLVRDSDHSFPNHTHDFYAFGLMEKGGIYCIDPSKDQSFVGPGQLALINPGQVHSGSPPKGLRSTYRMLYVSTQWMLQVAEEAGCTRWNIPEFPRMVVSDPDIIAELQALANSMETNAERLDVESGMISSFTQLMERYADPGPKKTKTGSEHTAIVRAQEFLTENLTRKVSLQELAEHTGLSRYHLLRVFKKATGIAPHAFHTQMRIEHSQRLLLSGVPIADAAFEAGFSDQSHFSNVFKQLVGATPGQYIAR